MNGRTSEAAFSIQRSAFSVRGSSFILHPSSFRYAAGFSLVEVCLALLVVGLGLLAIIGLFPGGLRSSENAEADTYVSLFADTALAGIVANASTVTAWSIWNDPGKFPRAATNSLSFASPFPDANGVPLRFVGPTFTRNFDERVWQVTLRVCPGQYGPTNWEVFGTYVFYGGM
jgi:Tfp pilus assembly protein PilV